MISFSGFVTYIVLNQSSSSQAVSFKAAIVDQLSGTFPNPTFNDNARTMLVNSGYTVDYYGPGQVTIDFFRSLPSKGYGIVIIRAHSTNWAHPTAWAAGHQTTIFTSEPWRSDRYVYEQLTERIGQANLYPILPRDQTYFVISSVFVRDSMQGRFPNSIIIMMGCTGLVSSEMAQAFVAKGARVYVGWDKSVTADRTDKATATLLSSLASGNNIEKAVSAAMSQVGPDPMFNSSMEYYPDNQGGFMLNLHVSQAPAA